MRELTTCTSVPALNSTSCRSPRESISKPYGKHTSCAHMNRNWNVRWVMRVPRCCRRPACRLRSRGRRRISGIFPPCPALCGAQHHAPRSLITMTTTTKTMVVVMMRMGTVFVEVGDAFLEHDGDSVVHFSLARHYRVQLHPKQLRRLRIHTL